MPIRPPYSFSAARRRALRLRRLAATSAGDGRTAPRVTSRRDALCPQAQDGASGGQTQSRDSRRVNCLTTRASKEWKGTATPRLPGGGGEGAQLVVHGDAEALEGAGRGVDAAPGPAGGRGDYRGQLQRRAQRPGADDGAGDAPAGRLLPEAPERC